MKASTYRNTAKGRAVMILNNLRRRSRRVTITSDWIAERLAGGCAKCGTKFRRAGTGFGNNSPTVDQLVPRGGYTEDNAVLLCMRCNRVKGSLTAAEKRDWANWEDDRLFEQFQRQDSETK